MTERSNIKIPTELFETIKEEHKPDHMSWPVYLEQELVKDSAEDSSPNGGIEIQEKLEGLESSVQEATQAAQNAERKVEELQR